METPIIVRPEEVFATCEQARIQGRRVGFVPTMGALHEGHLSLVAEAKRRADFTIVSIFVNPKQFGPSEDLDKYPRSLAADRAKLSAMGVDVIFAPSPGEMYPDGFVTEVSLPKGVSQGLCGARRPGHFDGVATVVTKLLNIVGSCSAVFGRKDYQQLQVIKRLVRDLNLPVAIIEGATVREPDGLAMSSRNSYLSVDDRQRALAIPEGLSAAHGRFAAGGATAGEILDAAVAPVRAAADRVDYIVAADADTLAPLGLDAPAPDRLLIAVAAFFGATRLIDNTVLGEDAPPS